MSDNKTIEEMKAELEIAGYTRRVYRTGWQWQKGSVYFLSAISSFPETNNELQATLSAYAHLQEQRELEALRKYILMICDGQPVNGDYVQDVGSEIITRFNITSSTGEQIVKDSVLEKTRSHWQEQRELEALRKFILRYDEAAQGGYSHELDDDSHELDDDSHDIIQEFNITPTESDESDQ